MKTKSKTAREIEKAFAAEAKAVPLVVGDAGALEREVERRKAAASARAVPLEFEVLPPSTQIEARPLAVMVSLFEEEFAAMQQRMKPATSEDLRAHTLRSEVLPRLEAWGFEARFRREITAWNCAEQEATFQVCRAKLRGVGAVVALIGKRGAGKTTIAAQLALACAWAERARRDAGGPVTLSSFLYRKVTSLVRRLKPLYANFGSTDIEGITRSLDALCAVDVLVIDEMHDLSELAVREAMLIDLIDRRYAALRDTLLISNQTPEEWDAQTPVSIASRIAEHGCVLKCEWASWRERR